VRGSAKAPASDPLAELARLIGQTDPFAEFGRETARRAAAPAGERADWDAPINSPYAPRSGADYRSSAAAQNPAGNGYYSARSEQTATESQNYGGQNYGRESVEEAPLPADADPYAPEHEARGYPPGQADYQHDGYEYDQSQQVAEEYYDDVPPSRWRLGVMAIVGVLALAVIGTAGAFGYRALFGSSGSSQPPPIIKADSGPSKVIPAMTGKDTQSGKLITDRVADRAQSEKLVSREEQPIDSAAAAALTQSTPQSALGTGVISNEPKKIRTIAIHPDQAVAAEAQAPAPPLAAARAAPAPAARPAPPPPRAPEASTADAEQNAPPPVARPAPQPRQAATAPGNVPLSLSPDAAPARAAAAPARTASVAPAAQAAPTAAPAAASAAGGGPGSYVQVSSQRSEAEAQAAFKSLQAKYPDQLGGRQPSIRQVDLGTKGTYYRAMVGPFASPSEAGEVCSSLKAAGGQCLIQRN
jgi:hypothetical protein